MKHDRYGDWKRVGDEGQKKEAPRMVKEVKRREN